jgi:hypothetical protein
MVFFWALILQAEAFRFFAPASNEFCFAEELSTGTLSVVIVSAEKEVGLSVIDSVKEELYRKTGKEHLLSFTALDAGVYKYCVKNNEDVAILVEFEVKNGVKAKDYSGIASTKQLKSVELKLRKLEDLTKDIHKKIQFLREREEELRNTNATIHDRVIGYSAFTIAVLLSLAFIEILYLKRYFRSKKMI